MKKLITVLFAAILIVSCAPKDSKLPREKEENIKENTEMFDKVFVEVYSHLTEELHSLMVIKDGKVIYERYALGHDAEEHHVLWSATKTFTATAVGFARQDGLLDVNDPITKFFSEEEIPQQRYDSLSRITIHDLLVMGSGLGDCDYNFEAGPDGKVDPVNFYFNSPIEAEPSGRWRYNNNDTHLAGIIVSRATGMKLKDYLDEKLFKPLGIRSYDWVEEPSGHNTGAFGLYMTTESIGKMALFMLQKGMWNGKRLLSEDWFDMAMTEQIFQGKGDPSMTGEKLAELHATNDWASGYGYQMWMMKDGRGCRLDGANGQFGIILPRKNAVVVMTSKCWNTGIELEAMWKYIYDELKAPSARFESFVCEAKGQNYDPDSQYRNPILPGFYPDPSICRHGDDYYMVNSSFNYFPIIPVWHSTDMIHWEQLGSVIEDDEILPLNPGFLEFGLYAPQISYNPHNNKFYVVCTQIQGVGNFFCTTDDPRSGIWSKPTLLPDVAGIDPSFYWEEDGTAVITSSTSPAEGGGKKNYSGDEAIIMWDFDWRSGKTIGKGHIAAQSGVHPEEEPTALEGPHIYKIDGKYFLIAAEGGTELDHRTVLFESDNLYGKFKPCSINPILTQRDLPADRTNPVSCTGHADLVQSAEGNWYAVFLGCQPYNGVEAFNTGRETFLLPVHWREGQPVILEKGEAVPTIVDMTPEMKELAAKNTIAGFDGLSVGPLWDRNGLKPFALTVRGSIVDYAEFNEDGSMDMICSGQPLDGLRRCSMVLQRMAAMSFTAETTVDFKPSGGSEAGLIAWHDDDHYMKLSKRLDEAGKPVLRLEERVTERQNSLHCMFFVRRPSWIDYSVDIPYENDKPVSLRLEAVDATTYVFSYAGPDKQWHQIGKPLDGSILSTMNCGGFQGAMVGVFTY